MCPRRKVQTRKLRKTPKKLLIIPRRKPKKGSGGQEGAASSGLPSALALMAFRSQPQYFWPALRIRGPAKGSYTLPPGIANFTDDEVVFTTSSPDHSRSARRLLAKSVMFIFLDAFKDVKEAVYPKLNILVFENAIRREEISLTRRYYYLRLPSTW